MQNIIARSAPVRASLILFALAASVVSVSAQTSSSDSHARGRGNSTTGAPPFAIPASIRAEHAEEGRVDGEAQVVIDGDEIRFRRLALGARLLALGAESSARVHVDRGDETGAD